MYTVVTVNVFWGRLLVYSSGWESVWSRPDSIRLGLVPVRHWCVVVCWWGMPLTNVNPYQLLIFRYYDQYDILRTNLMSTVLFKTMPMIIQYSKPLPILIQSFLALHMPVIMQCNGLIKMGWRKIPDHVAVPCTPEWTMYHPRTRHCFVVRSPC